MKSSRIIVLLVVFFSFLCKGEENTNSTTSVFKALPDDAILVRINEKDILTKDDVQRDLMVNLQLRCNKTNRHRANSADLRFARQFRESAQERFVVENALNCYANEHGIKPTEKNLASASKEIVRKFGRKGHRIPDLKYMLGDDAYRLDRMINNRALYLTIDDTIMSEPKYEVTAQMVDDWKNAVKSRNEMAALTNALIFAHATNVYLQVKAGLPFEEAAKQFSEDEYIDEGCEWGTFALKDLADEQALFFAVCALKPGEFTQPIESDNGLAIVRRDSTNFVDGAGQSNCTLSRIFFRLPLYFEELEDEEIIENYQREEHDRRWKETIEKAKEKLKIEYPHGTNLFAVAGSQP